MPVTAQVFAPFEALIAARGFVVMMGVDLTFMTLLHYAEQKAERQLFRRWANGPDGSPIEVETGGCSDGFEQLAPLLVSCERRIQVGQSVWRIFPAQDALEIAQQAIQQNPQITFCGDEDCGRCRDAIAGGPLQGG